MTQRAHRVCPRCKGATSHMAGPVMVSAYVGFFKDQAYDVCWNCNIARMRSPTSQWRDFLAFREKPAKPTWTKHTAFHWQMKINGELLDFWPGKRPKYRWQGQTYLGPPNIKALLR